MVRSTGITRGTARPCPEARYRAQSHANSRTPHCTTKPKRRQFVPVSDSAGLTENNVDTRRDIPWATRSARNARASSSLEPVPATCQQQGRGRPN